MEGLFPTVIEGRIEGPGYTDSDPQARWFPSSVALLRAHFRDRCEFKTVCKASTKGVEGSGVAFEVPKALKSLPSSRRQTDHAALSVELMTREKSSRVLLAETDVRGCSRRPGPRDGVDVRESLPTALEIVIG